MLFYEVSWIRAGGYKLCPVLKKTALELYRPLRRVPCFLQRPIKFIKRSLVKIPVIVQLQEYTIGTMAVKDLAASVGCRVHRELLDKKNRGARVDNWYVSLSGTSMATPVCSGVVAQMLQYNGSMTPAGSVSGG